MSKLVAKPLTQADFAAFGDVIEPYTPDQQTAQNCFVINEGYAVRHHALASIAVQQGEAGISIFAARARAIPIALSVMEYHPFGTQAFFSLQQVPYWIVVAPAGEPPQGPEDLSVFYAQGHQGIQYHRGVWHHPLLVTAQDSHFLVVDRIRGEGKNCIERDISTWDVHISD